MATFKITATFQNQETFDELFQAVKMIKMQFNHIGVHYAHDRIILNGGWRTESQMKMVLRYARKITSGLNTRITLSTI